MCEARVQESGRLFHQSFGMSCHCCWVVEHEVLYGQMWSILTQAELELWELLGRIGDTSRATDVLKQGDTTYGTGLGWGNGV